MSKNACVSSAGAVSNVYPQNTSKKESAALGPGVLFSQLSRCCSIKRYCPGGTLKKENCPSLPVRERATISIGTAPSGGDALTQRGKLSGTDSMTFGKATFQS